MSCARVFSFVHSYSHIFPDCIVHISFQTLEINARTIARTNSKHICFIWYFVMESRGMAIRRSTPFRMRILCSHNIKIRSENNFKENLWVIYMAWHGSLTRTNTNTNFCTNSCKCCHNSHTKCDVTNSNTSFVWFTLCYITRQWRHFMYYWNSIYKQYISNRIELIYGSKHFTEIFGICLQI